MAPAGRPQVGTPINIRLGDELLVTVDAHAKQFGISRAEAIRRMLTSSQIELEPKAKARQPHRAMQSLTDDQLRRWRDDLTRTIDGMADARAARGVQRRYGAYDRTLAHIDAEIERRRQLT